MYVVDDKRRKPIDFGLEAQSLKHSTAYCFTPITFKLHMYVVDDKRRKPIDFGLEAQSLKGPCQFWDFVYQTLWA